MRRTYFDLANHSVIYFSAAVILSGSWTPTDTFSIQFDDKTLTTWNSLAYLTLGTNCGNTKQASNRTYVFGKVFHNASQVTVNIGFNTSNKTTPTTLATKDVTLAMATWSSTDIEELNITINIPNSFRCLGTTYWNQTTGNCENCSSWCSFCSGPSRSQCIRPAFGMEYTGADYITCYGGCNVCTELLSMTVKAAMDLLSTPLVSKLLARLHILYTEMETIRSVWNLVQ